MNPSLVSIEDEWFVVVDRLKNEPSRMPLRDLEVLWETHQIDAHTFVWKQGMQEWRKIDDIPDLKRRILDDTSISFNQPGKPAANMMSQSDTLTDSSEPRKVSNILTSKADADDDPDSLEKKFEKIKQNLQGQNEVQNIELFNEENIEDLLLGLAGEDIEGEHGKKGKGKRKPAKTGPVVDLDTLTDEQIKKMEKNKKKAKKQAEKKREKWYMAKVNSNLYVKGLPEDITHDEMKEFFAKAGVIRLDLQTGLEKIKIYKDEKERPKGDALIAYMRPESVELAMEMLNETEIKPGVKVYLEPAQFEQKGNYVPRKKLKEDKVSLIKIKNDQERLLTWDEEDRGEGLKIVIITNVFNMEEVESEENFIENLRQDIQEECEAKLGPVIRVSVYESNPVGPVQIKFKDAAAAEGCIKLMNGRYFAGRQLACFYWDGQTDYKRTASTVEDEQRRLEEFGKWLEQDGEDKNGEHKNGENKE